MSYESESLNRFLNEISSLASNIHEDYKLSKKLFSQIQKETDFASIFEQTKSKELLESCKAFGRVNKEWINKYPSVIREFRQVVSFVIEELKQVKGIEVKISGEKVYISFNKQTFIYHFDENLQKENNFVLSQIDKEKITKEEEKIISEFADLISLDLHLEALMEYINRLNEQYSALKLCEELERLTDINSPLLIKNIHILSEWWLKIGDVLEKIKWATAKAVEMDDRVAKQLNALFNEEEIKRLKDQRLKAAKAGVLMLARLGLGLIPGGNVVNEVISNIRIAKESKAIINGLRGV